MSPRQMADPEFRAEQHARINEPHIAPISEYIYSQRTAERWLPLIAPLHAGVDARVLTVLRDPGGKTREDVGSGMLCIENDDPTAEAQYGFMKQGGMAPSDFTPWNSVPWWIGNRKPTSPEITEALPSLLGLVELLPKLEIAFLQGGEAKLSWKRALQLSPELEKRDIRVVATYHPASSALYAATQQEREKRAEDRLRAWCEVGSLLHG